MDRLSLSTQVILEQKSLLSHRHQVVTIGSCFSDHLGKKLLSFKWNTLINPFGTLFHPLGIFDLLKLVFSSQALPDEGFVESDGVWFHFALPKTFWAKSPEELQAKFQSVAVEFRSSCTANPACLMITLGTAQVYIEKSSGIIVSNCHKLPAQRFEKRLLSSTEIEESWKLLQPYLPKSLSFIWTLSPVRHLRETLPLNSVSKSLLRVWLHERVTAETAQHDYFPAYEIMLDELRDYRYYADDFLHPSQLAIEYLWELFIKYRTSVEAQDFCRQWIHIKQRLEHRPLHPEGPSWKIFLDETRKMLEAYENKLDVERELLWIAENLAETANK